MRKINSALLVIITFCALVLNVEQFVSSCALDQFMCDNKECVEKGDKCDGVKQCSDGSDEGEICTCVDTKGTVLFQCDTRNTCVFLSQQCDGHKDCPGGEDEFNCVGE